MADIFVSYTSSDRDWAFWIGRELGKLDHVAHVHEWEVPAGANIAAWMEERHDNADHILCVISKVYLTKPYSSWERQAAQWAAASKKPNFALPVFVEDCEPPTLLAPLKRCDLYGLSEVDARTTLAAYLAPAAKPPGPIRFPGEPVRSIPFPGSSSDPTQGRKVNVYVEARPKGRQEGTKLDDYRAAPEAAGVEFTNGDRPGDRPGVRMKSYKLKDAGKGSFRIDPLFKWVGFGAVDDAGRVITVRVEDIALERLHRSIGGGADYLGALEANRGRIFRIAQRKYERGSIEPDGYVSITDADVAEEV